MTQSEIEHNCRRVALVTTELGVGGAERCLVNLAIGLDRRRFAPVVFALAPPPEPARAALVRRLEEAGVPIHFGGIRKRRQLLHAVTWLAGQLRTQQIQLVQTFLFHANVVGAWAATRAHVPHLVTGIRVADPRRLRHLLERWATRRADRMVCVSESVRNFAGGVAGLPAEKLRVIPNGVDLALYDGARAADLVALGVPEGRRVLLSVGRLDAQKGFDALLDVAPTLLAELPDHDLLIVGDGPERTALAEQARQMGLVDRVHFPGWRGDIPSLLRAASGLLLPSRWEGMPNVLLEAMAAGKPVTATLVEGVAEVLGPLAAAQGVSPQLHHDFVEKTVGWARDPRLAAMLGRENRERVMRHYSLATMVATYERLYDELERPTAPGQS